MSDQQINELKQFMLTAFDEHLHKLEVRLEQRLEQKLEEKLEQKLEAKLEDKLQVINARLDGLESLELRLTALEQKVDDGFKGVGDAIAGLIDFMERHIAESENNFKVFNRRVGHLENWAGSFQ